MTNETTAPDLIALIDSVILDIDRMDGRSLYVAKNKLCGLKSEVSAAQARIAELEGALRDVREEICTGPVNDVLWHNEIPSETTVDFICNTLNDDWDYDKWLEARAALEGKG